MTEIGLPDAPPIRVGPLSRPERLVKGELVPVRPAGPGLTFKTNPEYVKPTGGVGGWGRLARPLLPSAVEWTGQPEEGLQFPLLFNGWPDQSVEDRIVLLRSFGEPRARRKPPPELRFRYGGMGRGATWVIDSLEWGEELRNRQLQRTLQTVTVTLLRYEEADVTLTPAERHRDRQRRKGSQEDDGKGNGGGGGRHEVYVVKAGDTLSSIAAKKLGKAGRWREIAKLNGLRDPNSLRVGQRLRLPEA